MYDHEWRGLFLFPSLLGVGVVSSLLLWCRALLFMVYRLPVVYIYVSNSTAVTCISEVSSRIISY